MGVNSLGNSEGAHKSSFDQQALLRSYRASHTSPNRQTDSFDWLRIIAEIRRDSNTFFHVFWRLCAPLFRLCTMVWCACKTVPQVSSSPHGSAKKVLLQPSGATKAQSAPGPRSEKPSVSGCEVILRVCREFFYGRTNKKTTPRDSDSDGFPNWPGEAIDAKTLEQE